MHIFQLLCSSKTTSHFPHNILLLNLQATILIMYMLIVLITLATSQNPPVAKPSCNDRCGNISIPFPFGTTADCYLSTSFWVTCNHTFYNPPKLFWQNTAREIFSISLLGQMTFMKKLTRDCYDYGIVNGRTNSIRPSMQLPEFFMINNTANKFTVVGCAGDGNVYGQRRSGQTFSTGCKASCNSEDDLEEGSCMGLGCCQTSIPKNIWGVGIELHTDLNNGDAISVTNNCTYGFLVEESAFNFSRKNLANLKGVEKFPLVLDWAIGNGTCEEAQKNISEYACKSENSLCFKPDNGYGYRCHCKDGYQGNPYLSGGCQDIDECSQSPGQNNSCQFYCVNTPGSFYCTCPKGHYGDGKIGGDGCKRKKSHTSWLVTGTSIGAIFLLLLVSLAYMEHNRRQLKGLKQKWFLQNGGEELLKNLPSRQVSRDTFRIFSSSELKKATNDFHKNNIVGQGGFGTVYIGILSDKRRVAIKKSRGVDPNQNDQFVNEVIVLSQINHRNIVKLLGCCLETEVPHLVYEFISNSTLYVHLQDPTRARFLNWENRLRIAAEIADALSYLHCAASFPVIHRDVKSDNILLDHNLTAKVCDFGASRLTTLDRTQISTVVKGTTGYLDPEYLITHQLTTKSDVYSFGVVMFELITGRTAIKYTLPEEERSLVGYSLSMMMEDKFHLLIDPHIASGGNNEQIMVVARLAEHCVNMKGEERPDMKIVATELESLRCQSTRVTKQNAKEMQPSLKQGIDGIVTTACGSSTSTGASDSFDDQVILPIRGGR